MKKTILITGGGGFIGRNLILALQKKNKIICLDKKVSSEVKKVFNRNVKIIENAVENNSALERALKASDLAVHLAGGGGNQASLVNPEWAVETHILGTYLLLEKCLKHKINKFIFASSCFVYGSEKKKKNPVLENSLLEPDTFYGILKRTAEEIIKNSGINYTIFRFANIYGDFYPLALPDKGVIYRFIKAGIEDNPIEIFGSGGQLINYVSIKDVVSGILLAMDSKLKSNIYNLGSEKLISIKELAKLVGQTFYEDFQRKVKIKRIPAAADRVSFNPLMSTEKIKKNLGWRQKARLEKEIKNLILNFADQN